MNTPAAPPRAGAGGGGPDSNSPEGAEAWPARTVVVHELGPTVTPLVLRSALSQVRVTGCEGGGGNTAPPPPSEPGPSSK